MKMSPNLRASALCCGGSSVWSRKKMTQWSSSAWRMSAMVLSSSTAAARSTPWSSAPHAPAIGWTSIRLLRMPLVSLKAETEALAVAGDLAGGRIRKVAGQQGEAAVGALVHEFQLGLDRERRIDVCRVRQGRLGELQRVMDDIARHHRQRVLGADADLDATRRVAGRMHQPDAVAGLALEHVVGVYHDGA